MDLDAAHDRYASASRAAQDHLLDVMNAQREGDPEEIRVAVAGLVAAQRAALDAHQHVVDAAEQQGVDHETRARIEAEHAQLSEHLAAVEQALDRLTVPGGAALEISGLDLSVPVLASAADMRLVAERLQRAAHIADRAGAPLLVGPLLDAAHLLRRTAESGADQDGGPAADLAAALLGYQDHIPMP